MKFKLKCSECSATAWAKGEDDQDTNSCEITDENIQWDGGCVACLHEDFEIIDQEYPEPLDGDVM